MLALLALAVLGTQASAQSVRFFGNGVSDIDRVKVRIDDPANSLPGPPVDIGATDFTLEFWMLARAQDNTAPAIGCGPGIAWIYGNIIVDRDRYYQDRKYGISIAGGRFVFGVSGDGTGDFTICGTNDVLDSTWHHIAAQRRRSDGFLWLYIDGALEGSGDGPDGDISYPDDGVPGNHCGGPCNNSDPFIVIGAEKHDAGPTYPPYSGWFDELRISTTLRYPAPFTRPNQPFATDAQTVGLYHCNEAAGDTLRDSSSAIGGPSHGILKIGGSPVGPVRSQVTPFDPPDSCCVGGTGNVDCDAGEGVDISDLSRLIDFLYISFTPLCCAGEANTDGQPGVDISDLSVLIDFLYISFAPVVPCP